MACLPSYWRNSSAIMKELQREGHTDDYVNTYLSYVNMQQANHQRQDDFSNNLFISISIYFYIISCQ